MSTFEKVEEKVYFCSWGKGKTADSYVVREGETLTGVIEIIKDSTKGYGKIYTLRTKDCDTPIVITGKTDLNNKLGYGSMSVKPVEVGDEVKITYVGKYKTEKGTGFKFDVAVKRNK
jgi:hypothetical protein